MSERTETTTAKPTESSRKAKTPRRRKPRRWAMSDVEAEYQMLTLVYWQARYPGCEVTISVYDDIMGVPLAGTRVTVRLPKWARSRLPVLTESEYRRMTLAYWLAREPRLSDVWIGVTRDPPHRVNEMHFVSRE